MDPEDWIPEPLPLDVIDQGYQLWKSRRWFKTVEGLGSLYGRQEREGHQLSDVAVHGFILSIRLLEPMVLNISPNGLDPVEYASLNAGTRKDFSYGLPCSCNKIN